jgi:RHS repeat-associated protein
LIFSLFTGKMLTEETGLVYFGVRWYDPEVGKFISVDPAEQGENWYSFCDNDPINNYDPDGRLSLRGWGVFWGGLKVGFKQYALKMAADAVSKVGLKFAGLIATTQGMKAIMRTGILQKAGVWLSNTSERGSIKLNGSRENWGKEHGTDKILTE